MGFVSNTDALICHSMHYQPTLDYARQADAHDPLRDCRAQFLFPQYQGKEALYFCGNSLGLQPRNARQYLLEELDDWAAFGVEGHHCARRAWLPYHEFFSPRLAKIVGALPEEVVVMNGLTVNLHLLLISFYRPTAQRFKIVIERGAFPSDKYAVDAQIRLHGFDPAQTLLQIAPRPGEDTLRTEDILETIRREGNQIALVLLSGVQYYTGQLFDIEYITKAGHQIGAFVGFDLAHAVGNVPLSLHDWGVDFAVWCHYKYMNAGPGAAAGAFVHQRHFAQSDIPRLEGWWGQNKTNRFRMTPDFDPIPTAEAWQLSNAPVFSMAPLLASLDLFDKVGMEALQRKSRALTGYLEYLLLLQTDFRLRIITPADPQQRGCQLSIQVRGGDKSLFQQLSNEGVIADWREPDVIRVAPVPLYNSFEDVYHFVSIVHRLTQS